MSFVILGHCCKDGSCLRVCPQNCIHPAPGDPEFATVEHLSIDPAACIGCSACVDACPVAAVKPEAALTEAEQVYARQADAYRDRPRTPARPVIPVALPSPLRIAVVGAGSAAMYTVREVLQRSSSVRVTVFERSAHLGGLLHTAVSPDHPGIRRMTRLFDVPFADPRVEIRFGTRVGADVSIESLRDRFDAVILAFGAAEPRAVAGSALPEVHQAIDLLAAAHAARRGGGSGVAVAGPTTVIVGGGNVALDVVTGLARGRIRTHAGALVSRAVVVARAPASRPSFTFSALHELGQLAVDITVTNGHRLGAGPLDRLLSELAQRDHRGAGLSVELVFGREVTALRPVDGRLRVVTARVTAQGRVPAADLSADSVVLASGFTCAPPPGVPLGPGGAVSHRAGAVVSPETGEPIAGLYVVGWAKRGGRGGVGENRRCAAQTVDTIAADLAAPDARTPRRRR
ncbi:FAD-dependent oxidoreductase [Nocardia sp. SSK8]|uniref:FAD-dependent oxidoreductase n=1 Tax=Nocardia sp. SSK8 TaxID=3120154 RepID=UPI00300ADA6C